MFHRNQLVPRPAALIHQHLRIVISKKKVRVLNKVLLLSSITATNIIYVSAAIYIIVQYIFKYSIINFIFPLSAPFYFSHDHLNYHRHRHHYHPYHHYPYHYHRYNHYYHHSITNIITIIIARAPSLQPTTFNITITITFYYFIFILRLWSNSAF